MESIAVMKTAQETIMARIREALRLPAAKPHLKSSATSATPAKASRPWLPDGGETQDARLTVLTENLAKLKAQLIRVADMPQAAVALAELCRAKQWKRLAYHAHTDTQEVIKNVSCETWQADAEFDKQKLESCDAGLTTCEAIVAQTGSIIVSSSTNGGRSLSILPHAHVVIARADQVMGDLADAFVFIQQRNSDRMPSMISFITGPSRTGDIERILVLGAHGPKELVLILVG
jgi:L-lactate dehydrogenase complex protein LldG